MRLLAAFLATLGLCVRAAAAPAPPTSRVVIEAGPLDTVLAVGSVPIPVARFALDRTPVTNGQFLEFVRTHPSWRRDAVAPLYAEAEYLSHWSAPDVLGEKAQPDQPVTRVSWFAARAYCESQGGRLPTWFEWERVAIADAHRPDAHRDPAWQSKILQWYAQPASQALAPVGRQPPNVYGVQDLHGLIWEWVEDFNALTLGAGAGERDSRLKSCGAGALSLADRESYALSMRIAYLSALEARSTTRSLGFRCAADVP